MVPIAESSGVRLHCPEDSRYSFYNSPYPAHRLMTGIDIYSSILSEGIAQSPVSGEILQVRRVKAPPGRGFLAPDHDTATVISTQAPDRIVKILHVDTELSEGDGVRVGEPMGRMIRSGYFGYQTPLHAHVEVRPAGDPLRVRGGYAMENLLDLDNLRPTHDLSGIVVAARKGYAQIQLRGYPTWAVAEVGSTPGILDGGIPLYGWFGVHLKSQAQAAQVSFLGKTIGVVTKTGARSCVAECSLFEARIGGTPVDLFFTLTPKDGTVLVSTSKRRGLLDLSEGDAAEVTIA